MAQKYILVVDDDPDLVETVAMMLESKGCEVGRAYDGVEAEESIKERRPDLVILDIMMPRKDGYVLCAEMKEKDETRDIPGFIIPSPFFDVGIDPDGFLWAANTGRHSLENYTLDGDFRSSWGEFTIDIEGFCGCCNPTHFVLLDDGRFITSEKGIPRIKEYNRLGNLESVVAGPDQFIEGTVGLDLARDSGGKIYVLDPMKKEVRIFKKNPGV